MGRRNRRRNGDLVSVLLTGISILATLVMRRRSTRFVRPAPNWGPMIMMVFLVGAFIALGLFVAILASLASILQSPALSSFLCVVPLAISAFAIWASRRGSGRRSPELGRAEDTGSAATSEGFSWEPVVGTTNPGNTRAAAPATGPTVRREKSLAEEYPEKGTRPPGEYRQRAVSYRRRIESLLKKRRPGPVANRIKGVLENLKNWEERVGQLADRLSLFETDELIQRDLREVPGHIERLRRQASLEADPEMQRQMRRTLAAYEEQLRQLRLLARVMRRTRFNLDDTLAAMGTVYSQVQVLNAMDVDGPVAARIDQEIGREVDRLNDLLSALSEVYTLGSSAVEPQPQTTLDEDAELHGRRARLGSSTTG